MTAATWLARIRSPGTVLLAAAFALLLFSRRSGQLLSPQVWDEDGTVVLAGLLARGWSSLAEPVNGYLILVPKLVSALSLSVSFYHYPLVSTLLTWGVIVAAGIAIARSPTILRAPALCALAVFMVPSDPEVFGLPLYLFWWTNLLVLLAALWNDEGRGWGWRLAFIVLGGFSSPVIVMILPVLLARAIWGRNRGHEVLALALGSVAGCVQLYFVLKHGVSQTIPPLASLVLNTFPVLIGKFLVGSWVGRGPILWGATLFLFAIVALHWRRGSDRRAFWTLAYLLAGAIALTVSRVDPAILDPRTAGPRYFFLPFVLLSWLLVQCVASGARKPHGALAVVALLVAAVNAVPGWSRRHDDLNWAESVRSCARFDSYPLPVQFDGNANLAWRFWVAGSVCAERMAGGLWPAPADVASLPTTPYVKFELAEAPPGTEPGTLASTTMTGTDWYRSSVPGYRVIGSFKDAEPETGEVNVRMRRGGQLRYRSGNWTPAQVLTIVGHDGFSGRLPHAANWVLLDFSDKSLPEEFVVRIEDQGPGWSAVALKAP